MRTIGLEGRVAEAILFAAVLLAAGIRAVPGRDPGPLPEPGELVHRIDLNRSPVHELVHLPGIGRTRAEAIVRHRREHGDFSSPEELGAVPGVGPATVAGIREYLSGTGGDRWKPTSTGR